ncbi:hypothetical protein C8J56DRAFT_1048719 [Mycena floridula]|nr:hypothetical protein C8J56DRAFT_1048719 [Mycena floridula]
MTKNSQSTDEFRIQDWKGKVSDSSNIAAVSYLVVQVFTQMAYRRPSTQPSMTLPEVTIKKRGRGVSDVEVVPASEIVDLTQNFETLPTTPRLTKQSATGGVWKSPDHRALRDTLGKGGMNLPAEELMTKLDTNVLLNVKFFPVLKLDSQRHQATLEVITNVKLGQGAFKSANKGLLTIHAASQKVITSDMPWSQLNQMMPVVCKRFFYVSQEEETQGQKLRYAPKDELPKVITEANIMFWSHALQGMTYDFMDREIESGAIPPPTFAGAKIRPRFVNCGIALAMQSGGSIAGSFLIKEEIPGKFIKYILNS